ncbi:protein FAM114A2-like isoform X3 [Ostrea edulis]|uniref:protein FAM114A2-like isoform X3 n=1 Tax=Ostrea edulis TaxID=37623 RepID=UPI0024AEF7AB|nr:protein FAM114A2-like isoform X3 [Ostrea edulis]
MSDSEDDAAFASADEGESDPLPVHKPSSTQGKVKTTEEENKGCKAENENGERKSACAPKMRDKEMKTDTKICSDSKTKESIKKEVPAVKKQEEKSKGGKGKKKRGKQTKTEPVKDSDKDSESALGKSVAVMESPENDKSSPPQATELSQGKQDQNVYSEGKLVISEPSESPESDTMSCENKTPLSATSDVEKNYSGRTVGKPDFSITEEKKTMDAKQKESKGVEKESQQFEQRENETKSALDRLTQPSKQKSDNWGSWGNWGSSLMNVASTSVSTFSNQLGEGFTTIMDSVETALGAPPIEELLTEKGPNSPPDTVKMERQEKEDETIKAPAAQEDEQQAEIPTSNEASGGSGWWSGWGMSNLSNLSSVVHNTTNIVQKSVQNTTNIVQKSSKTLVTGGLDVLETIGKKTFEVIKDHDPGLSRTKEFLFDKSDKPSLSQLLREAQKEEKVKEERKKEEDEARLTNLKAMFEENQGYAHLEALEMLSNMCEKTVHSLLEDMSDNKLDSIKAELIRIKQVFERMQGQNDNDDDDDEDKEHDFGKLVAEHLTEIHLGTTPDKLNKTQEKIRETIAKYFASDDHMAVKEIHQSAIQSLAEITSKSLEQFHKAGELIILQRDTSKNCESRAHSLERLAKVLTTEVGIIATKFCHCLNKLDESENPDITSVVTNIYLESSNSTMYIQDALQLLLPCLQQAAIQRSLT